MRETEKVLKAMSDEDMAMVTGGAQPNLNEQMAEDAAGIDLELFKQCVDKKWDDGSVSVTEVVIGEE